MSFLLTNTRFPVNSLKSEEIPPRNGLYQRAFSCVFITTELAPSRHLSGSRSLRMRSSVVFDAMECVTGSVTMMVGVGGTMSVADAERCTVH